MTAFCSLQNDNHPESPRAGLQHAGYVSQYKHQGYANFAIFIVVTKGFYFSSSWSLAIKHLSLLALTSLLSSR